MQHFILRTSATPQESYDFYLYNEIISSCNSNSPQMSLPPQVRAELEQMPPCKRRTLTSMMSNWDTAPLHVASSHGQINLVKYLLRVCSADINLRGTLYSLDVPIEQGVTPIWCASAGGHFEVMYVLMKAGADLNVTSRTGNTAVNFACITKNFEVVRRLVKWGADINRPDANGKTCLINSLHSMVFCKFLLDHGANVNAQDSFLKTALHYAIENSDLKIIRLLLHYGANPLLRSQDGDDSLRFAALKGQETIVALLKTHIHYPVDVLINSYELLGATCFDLYIHKHAARAAWRHAATLRRHHNRPLIHPLVLPFPILGESHERDILEYLISSTLSDSYFMDIQTLMMIARVLGTTHPEVTTRIMKRGTVYLHTLNYHQCINLWNWALLLRVEAEPLINPAVCSMTCSLTRLMIDVFTRKLWGSKSSPIYCVVLRVYTLIVTHISEARRLIDTSAPNYNRDEVNSFDRILNCVTHLIYLLVKTATTIEERRNVERMVHELMAADIRSVRTGNTLLHLCMLHDNNIPSCYFSRQIGPTQYNLRTSYSQSIFPDVEVTELMLLFENGRAVRARNFRGSTPLHKACVPINFSLPVVRELLAAGAHLCTPNISGSTPAARLARNINCPVDLLNDISLMCLAAKVCARLPHSTLDVLPLGMQEFVNLHFPYCTR